MTKDENNQAFGSSLPRNRVSRQPSEAERYVKDTLTLYHLNQESTNQLLIYLTLHEKDFLVIGMWHMHSFSMGHGMEGWTRPCQGEGGSHSCRSSEF